MFAMLLVLCKILRSPLKALNPITPMERQSWAIAVSSVLVSSFLSVYALSCSPRYGKDNFNVQLI